jgi:hypothetical protein
MKLSVKDLVDGVRKFREKAEKQTRYATAVALTQTAVKIKQAMPAALDAALDKPTKFTKDGIYTKAAKRDKLVSEVGFKDRQSRYMRYQVEGGVRKAGDAGIKLPGNIKLNTFGNIPRGMIQKLKDAAQNGSLAPAIARRLGASGSRRKGAKPVELFFGVPQGKGWEDAPLGIWRRIPGERGGPGKLVPVIVFEDTGAKYEKRFDFERMAQKVVLDEFDGILKRAIENAIATAK